MKKVKMGEGKEGQIRKKQGRREWREERGRKNQDC